MVKIEKTVIVPIDKKGANEVLTMPKNEIKQNL